MAWYVSLTLRWEDVEGKDKDPFLNWCAQQTVRWNHVRMERKSWHSTVYAIARLDSTGPHQTMRLAAREVLDYLRMKNFSDQLRTLERFKIAAYELRYYVGTTSIQFEGLNGKIPKIRQNITDWLSSLQKPFSWTHCEFPFWDGTKNAGERFFGSIGRAPVPENGNSLQQIVSLHGVIKGIAEKPLLHANKLILTISDDALTNPFEDGDYETIALL